MTIFKKSRKSSRPTSHGQDDCDHHDDDHRQHYDDDNDDHTRTHTVAPGHHHEDDDGGGGDDDILDGYDAYIIFVADAADIVCGAKKKIWIIFAPHYKQFCTTRSNFDM